MSGIRAPAETEELIPGPGRIPLPRAVPWWFIGGVLLVAFVALGIYGRDVHEDPRQFALLAGNHPHLNIHGQYTLLRAYSFFIALVPLIVAVAMLWAAFVNPRRVDDLVWSAALTLTSCLAGLAALQLFFERRGYDLEHTYPTLPVVVGLVGYGTFVCALQKSSFPPVVVLLLRSLCVLALAAVLAFPLLVPGGRIIDYLGAILLAGALFALGVFVAERAGVDLFVRNAETGDST